VLLLPAATGPSIAINLGFKFLFHHLISRNKLSRASSRECLLASLSLRAKRGNLLKSQKAKIKRQNDRAKIRKQSVISIRLIAEG